MRVMTSSSRDPEVRSSPETGTGVPASLSGGGRRFPGPSATGCQLSASRLCCVSAGWRQGSSRPISGHPRTVSRRLKSLQEVVECSAASPELLFSTLNNPDCSGVQQK